MRDSLFTSEEIKKGYHKCARKYAGKSSHNGNDLVESITDEELKHYKKQLFDSFDEFLCNEIY